MFRLLFFRQSFPSYFRKRHLQKPFTYHSKNKVYDHFKSSIFSILLVICLSLLLFFPSASFQGAKEGLLLWFNTVLPTLFPFMVLCNLCVRTDVIFHISKLLAPFFGRFFHVSSYGSFAILAGFLCGYPMGSKVAADLYRQGNISQEECRYLISFCNNTSPMFILNFLVTQNLQDENLKTPVLLILFISPILCSFIFRRTFKHHSSDLFVESSSKKNHSEKLLDNAISDALDAITKVGAYILLFSVLIQILQEFFVFDSGFSLLLLSCLEVSNGISLLCHSELPQSLIFVSSLFLTSFGGLCAALQTDAMIKGTGVSLFSYIAKKLVTAMVTSLFAFIYLALSS